MRDYINKAVLFQLAKDNIDIEGNEFFYNSTYEDYRNVFLLGVEKTSITLKWYIEKYLLSDERREQLYSSVYCLGIFREFSDAEEDIETFCKALQRYDNRDDVAEIKRSLFRNDGKDGIAVWIDDLLDIDIMNDRYSTRDRYKVLYLLYTVQKELGIEIRALLKKPTLENLDNRFIGFQSNNGDIVARIKDELTKEVKDTVRANINNTLSRAAKEWKTIILMLHQHLMCNDHEACVKNLRRIISDTNRMVNFYKSNNYIIDREESYTLLERMYFEISCFENRGIEEDIIQVNHVLSKTNDKIKQVLNLLSHDELNTLINDYKEYVNENLYTSIGSKIYGTTKLTSNQKRKLKDSVEQVYDIYEYIIEKTDLFPGFMSYGFLVILFAEIVFMDKKETINNNFYRYEKMYTVNTEVKKGRMAHDKAKLIIVQRVLNHYQEARGFREEIEMVREIESNIDFLMNIVFSQHSMEGLLYVHAKLYRLVRPTLFFESKVVEKANEVIECIEKESGFKCILYHNSIKDMFRYYFESEGMLSDIKNMSVETVCRANKTNKVIREVHSLEMIDDDGYRSLSSLIITVIPKDKVIVFEYYERHR